MKISGNTILITGGATGIGLALAEGESLNSRSESATFRGPPREPLENDDYEVAVGAAAGLREQRERLFSRINH